MRAGLRRHRISIRRRPTTEDAFTELTGDWTDICTRIPARVRDDNQREFTANLQVQSQKTVHVNIRDPRRPITERDQIVWHARGADRVYDIKAVLAGDNNSRELDITCIEHT